MTNVTITYSRNKGDERMPSDEWNAFHDDVRRVLSTADAITFADAAYRGRWEGQYEDARITLAQVDDDLVPLVRSTLTDLARVYGQDAIGFTSGEGELLTPDDTE